MNVFRGMVATALALAVIAFLARVSRGDERFPTSGPIDAGHLRHAIEQSMRGDAALADVCFVDASNGWAVGDRGVIWYTNDGGRTWQQQTSHVTERLRSVFFLDERRGWAVGGGIQPATHASRGTVLRTLDGGKTWTKVPQLVVPMLTRVRFFDAQQGVALGVGEASFPGGAFYTTDGGRSWQPVATDEHGDWLAGDFLDPHTGAVAGTAGRLATVTEGRLTASPLSRLDSRTLRGLRLVAPTGGWLVGDGGLVMTTHDAGRSWQTPPTELPEFVAENFDFQAVAVRASNVWVAGSPGSQVFHSPDGGHTWDSFATGQTVPLRAMSFVDERTGWAVGDLGTILATRDGGQSWQMQRAGGRRAALLALFGRETDVPLEMIAQYGAAEGYLTAIEVLHPPAAAANSGQSDLAVMERGRAAMVLAGATTAESAWRFPLPPSDLALSSDDLLAALNRAHDNRAVERLMGHLVRQLRTWRPEVVVTYHADWADTDPVAALNQPLILRAIEAAADPTQYVDLATDVGLGAWRVKKVYGLMPMDSRGEQLIDTNRFTSRLGRSLADWTAPARHLLDATFTPPPDTYSFKLLSGDNVQTTGRRDFFTGCTLSPGGEARRAWSPLPEVDLDALRRMAERRRNMQELLEGTEAGTRHTVLPSAGSAAWAGQVANLVDGLDDSSGGELMFQLAEGYRTAGRLDLAADTYYLLTRRWPDHPLADRALVWLTQFYASSEMATRCQPSAIRRRPEEEQPLRADGAVQQTSAVVPLGAAKPAVGLSRDDRLRRAAQLGKYLEETRPALFAEPGVRFPLVAAQRQLGFANPAQRYFLILRGLPRNEPWRRCAETELWFAKPTNQPPPKALGTCRRTYERPHLDGQLDEPLWSSAEPLRLGEEAGAEVQLAYDEQFLYLGMRCQKVEGVDYPADHRPRSRDTDLSQHDRVALRLDVDRDFTTWYELVVDHRGWPGDTCWGDASWDPRWFIAAADDEEAWTVEAAVPLAELVVEPPASRHVWAAAVRRTIPKTGHQSWADDESAADDSPDQFGLLIFE